MGQHKRVCEACHRKPGYPHDDLCPRSRVQQRRLYAQMKALGTSRWFYISTGAFQVKRTGFFSRLLGLSKPAENPGIPWVKPPKPWYAGGWPRGLKLSDVDKIMREAGIK